MPTCKFIRDINNRQKLFQFTDGHTVPFRRTAWNEEKKVRETVETGTTSYFISSFNITDHGFGSSYVAAPETYLFPANEAGKIIDFMELPGSIRGTHSHEDALANAEYTLVP